MFSIMLVDFFSSETEMDLYYNKFPDVLRPDTNPKHCFELFP